MHAQLIIKWLYFSIVEKKAKLPLEKTIENYKI